MMNAPTLAQLKNSLGVEDELFDKLFSVPTPLQVSLCSPPGERGMKDLKNIIRVLRDYEITKNIPEDGLYDIARQVEYRTVVRSHAAYLQGEVAESLVFVVSGTVQVKMRNTKQDTVVIGTIERGGWFNDGAMLMKGARKGTKYYDSTVKPQLNDEDAVLHEEEHGSKDEEKKEPIADFKDAPAALRETYYCSTNCEFLLFSAPLFEKYFKAACNEQQKAKFLALKRSMIFKGWTTDAIVRLARMSRMVTIPRNEKIVRQNEECDSMYFLVKGVVIVSKYPDKVAQLERTLRDLKKQLSESRTKYSYHRSMQSSNNKIMSKLNSRKLTLARGARKIQGGEGVMVPEEAISAGEKMQEELERRIETVKRMIKICKKKRVGVREDQELKVLVPPDFVGGEALLEPDDGKGYGTVTTDTVIHAVKVHKAIFRTFKVDRNLLEKVKTMATHFPNDIVLEDEIRMNQGWDEYKAKQMEGIKKSKWPIGKGGIVKNLPGGRSVVVESMAKKGDVLRGVF
jgi:CRP-like cAMP-binding protein